MQVPIDHKLVVQNDEQQRNVSYTDKQHGMMQIQINNKAAVCCT